MKRREDAKVKKMKVEKNKATVLIRSTPNDSPAFSSAPPLPHLRLFFLSLSCVQLEQEAKDPKPKAEPTDPTAPQAAQQPAPPPPVSPAEPKKPGRRRSVKVEAPPPVQQTDEERIAQGKRVLGARSKAKALAKAQAEAEAAAQAALTAKRAAERRAQTQRRLEERKRQQLIAEELKKPIEDMCLTDHKVSCVIEPVSFCWRDSRGFWIVTCLVSPSAAARALPYPGCGSLRQSLRPLPGCGGVSTRLREDHRPQYTQGRPQPRHPAGGSPGPGRRPRGSPGPSHQADGGGSPRSRPAIVLSGV